MLGKKRGSVGQKLHNVRMGLEIRLQYCPNVRRRELQDGGNFGQISQGILRRSRFRGGGTLRFAAAAIGPAFAIHAATASIRSRRQLRFPLITRGRRGSVARSGNNE